MKKSPRGLEMMKEIEIEVEEENEEMKQVSPKSKEEQR